MVSRVEPSLQAAFIDFGRIKHGFLAFNDIQSDYYQIPAEDKEKLKDIEEKIREDLKNKTLDNSSSEDDINQNYEKTKTIEENKDIKNKPENENNYRETLKKSYGVRRYRIQEVIKPGQVVLIQVLKEERGAERRCANDFYFTSR